MIAAWELRALISSWRKTAELCDTAQALVWEQAAKEIEQLIEREGWDVTA